jgi:hypothetical protein
LFIGVFSIFETFSLYQKMQLTKQSKIALAGMIIGVIALLLPYGPHSYNFLHRVGEVMIYILMTCAVVYTIQCQTRGNCENWATFLSLFVFFVNLFSLLFHGSATYITMTMK